MSNIIAVVILIIIIGGALLYICRQKKKGVHCIGCPMAGSCGKSHGCCHGPSSEVSEKK